MQQQPQNKTDVREFRFEVNRSWKKPFAKISKLGGILRPNKCCALDFDQQGNSFLNYLKIWTDKWDCTNK